MQFLNFIVLTVTQIYIFCFLLREWIDFIKICQYTYCFQMIVKITDPILKLINKIPTLNNILYFKSFFIAYIFTVLSIIFIIWTKDEFPKINLSLLIICFIQLLTYIGKLIFWVILIQINLKFFHKQNSDINFILNQILEPLLYIVKNIFPFLNQVNFLKIIIILVLFPLNFLKNDILLLIDSRIAEYLLTNSNLL
ncbi:hypothetical protein AOQ88_00130 [Candidatus Riesia sp. GBBU]|nr:hypothetical protein AOQ88_00130 [Candidatus Riesia sp. GBBU]